MQVRPGGYRELLSSEIRLRSLWVGTLASSLGDWLRHVSVLALVISLTGAGLEMGLVCVLEFIPLVFFGPLAGAVADRWNVRRLMVWAGRDAAFVLDAATFLLSAGLLFSMKDGKEKAQATLIAGKASLRVYGEEILAGLRYIKENRKVSALITFNTARFAGSGAMYVLLGAFGSRVFQGGDAGVGIFYASFGAGFFLGSLVTRFTGERLPAVRYAQAMGITAAAEGGLVIIFSGIDALVPALLFLTGAYAARGFCVTYYTTALMSSVDEAVRGKVFVFERVAASSVMALAMMGCSWGLGLFTPQLLALVTGSFLLLNGAVWFLRSQNRMEAPALSGAEEGG